MKATLAHWVDEAVVQKILLCLMSFVSYFFGIAYYIHSQSVFISQIGLEQLPFVMVFGSLTFILYSVVSSFLSNKISALPRFIIFTVLISLFYASLSLLSGRFNVQIYLFLLISGFFLDFLSITLLNVFSSFMTPLQARNSQPLINGFISLGIILGSYFALDLQKFNERFGLGFIPAVSLLLIVFLAFIFKFFSKNPNAAAQSEKPKKMKLYDELKDGFQFIFRRSNLFKTFTFIIFLFIAIRVYSNFKFKTVLSENFKGDGLTEILGKINIIECVLALFIDSFLTKKILSRFGVARIFLVYPLIMLATFSFAVFTGLPLFAVVLFCLSASIPVSSFVLAANFQVFFLLPQRESSSVYFIIDGILAPIVELFIYLTLLVYSANIHLETFLNTGLIGLLIVLLIFAALKLQRYYQMELQDDLFKDNIYLKHRAIELLAEQDQRNRGEINLRRVLSLNNIDEESRLGTINTLGIIGNYESIENLMKILKDGNPKEIFAAIQAINMIVHHNRRKFDRYPVTKHLLLRTYKEMFISNISSYLKFEIISSLKYFNLDEVIDFFEKNLASDDSQIRMNILEMMSVFHDKGIVTYAEPFLADTNLRVVASAIVALWQFPDMRIYLIPKMTLIFSKSEPENIDIALFLIGSIKAVWEKTYVESKINSTDPHIHNHALLTLMLLGERKYVDQFLQEFSQLTKKGQESEIEFTLSKYRKFDQKMKNLIVSKIQQMPLQDVQSIKHAFEQSKYIFNQELYYLRDIGNTIAPGSSIS